MEFMMYFAVVRELPALGSNLANKTESAVAGRKSCGFYRVGENLVIYLSAGSKVINRIVLRLFNSVQF